jgi:hypothetical protein
MGYDYTKNLTPTGQFDRNACWAASISWWTEAMALNYKRKISWQSDLIQKFDKLTNEDGSMPLAGIRKVCESAEIRIKLVYMSPSTFQKSYTNIDLPMIVVFNYPVIGGTHMNVIFNQKQNTVACMEPYYPYPGKDGQRPGQYVRRAMSFYQQQ